MSVPFHPSGMDWAKPGIDGSFDVMNTCTHKADGCIITQEAEQVTILWAPLLNRYHFSVQYRGWFTCHQMVPDAYEQLEMTDILRIAKSKSDFLKLLVPPDQE